MGKYARLRNYDHASFLYFVSRPTSWVVLDLTSLLSDVYLYLL